MDPDPPAESHEIYRMPNVMRTPHIAGAMGNEMGRMGQHMADELDRYLNGRPLQWEITQEQLAQMA